MEPGISDIAVDRIHALGRTMMSEGVPRADVLQAIGAACESLVFVLYGEPAGRYVEETRGTLKAIGSAETEVELFDLISDHIDSVQVKLDAPVVYYREAAHFKKEAEELAKEGAAEDAQDAEAVSSVLLAATDRLGLLIEAETEAHGLRDRDTGILVLDLWRMRFVNEASTVAKVTQVVDEAIAHYRVTTHGTRPGMSHNAFAALADALSALNRPLIASVLRMAADRVYQLTPRRNA